MMGEQIDETEWPLVTVRWSGAISDAVLNGFLVQMDGWLGRGGPFGLLLDARGAQGLSPEQRARVVSHMKKHAALTAKLLFQATVIDNLVQRTLFYGINLIFPNPFPSKVFAEPAAARAWLRSVLGKAMG
jgi:hypothetical protein